MKSPRITTSFTALSDGNLEKKALAIIDAMTDNANFPTPTPALSDVSAALTDYSNALSLAQNRDKLQVAIKNTKRKTLLNLLKELATYVNFIANGNKSVIISAGFDASKDGVSAPPLTQPKNFKVKSGMNSGQAITSISGVKGARSYVHQCTPDPLTDASVWESNFVTTRTFTFEGMVPGKKTWFRVGAVGTGKQRAYTDPISMVIQ